MTIVDEIAALNLLSVTLAIIAGALCLKQQEGWWWFLIAALLCFAGWAALSGGAPA